MTDQPIKGQNLITPGYDALSKYCDFCEKFNSLDRSCTEFGENIRRTLKGRYERTQACLDSEIPKVNASLEGVGEADLPVCPTCKVAGDDELDLFLIGMSDHEWDGNGECPTCHRRKPMPDLEDFPSFAKYVREGARVEVRFESRWQVWEFLKSSSATIIHVLHSTGHKITVSPEEIRIPRAEMDKDKGAAWCKENVNLEAWRGDYDENGIRKAQVKGSMNYSFSTPGHNNSSWTLNGTDPDKQGKG